MPNRLVTSTASPVGKASARRSVDSAKRFSAVKTSCPLSPNRLWASAFPSFAKNANVAMPAVARVNNELLTSELDCRFPVMALDAITHESGWELDNAGVDGRGRAPESKGKTE